MWNRRTKTGRIVYDRPKHSFSVRDLERIQRRVFEDNPAEILDDGFARVIITIVDNLSEYLVDVMLSPVGLDVLSDDVVAFLKKLVDTTISGIAEYLEEARGPFGAAGET